MRTLVLILLLLAFSCRTKKVDSWCSKTLRPELSAFPEIDSGQPWFRVSEVGEGVYAIAEPYNFQEVISYLIVGTRRCILFDTGMGMGKISDVVKRISPLPVLVINSHTHYDHIGGNHEFETVLGVDTAYTRNYAKFGWSHTEVRQEVTPDAFCAENLPSLDTAQYAIMPYQNKIRGYLHDGDTLELGDRLMEVVIVPGHTPDCVALLDRQRGYLWTGDMFYEALIWLFMDGTDLDAYEKSIDRFAALAPKLSRVFPAHNKPTAVPSHLLDLTAAFDSIRTGKKPPEPVVGFGYLEDKTGVQFTFRDFSFLVRREFLEAGKHPELDILGARKLQLLTGVWVKSDYVDDVARTKSPAKSSKKLKGIVTLIVDPKNLSGNTITVGTSINNHEGGFFHATLSEGQTPASFHTDIEDQEKKTNFYDLGYEISPGDTSLFLLRYDQKGLLVGKVQFSKVCASQSRGSGADYGIGLIVNKLLFEGTYDFTDSAGRRRTVTFDREGRVRGWDGHEKYEVQTDFVTEEDEYRDVLFLDDRGYGFVISGNRLQLFEMSEDDEHRLELGKLKYQLMKREK